MIYSIGINYSPHILYHSNSSLLILQAIGICFLMHDKISLTPHIGAATNEAQDRIGLELANQIISILVK